MITNINGGELGKIRGIDFGSQLKFFQRYFVGKAFRQAKIIVCGSDFISSKVKEFYNNETAAKVKKIPFGVDEELFKPSPPVPLSFRRGGGVNIINIANAVPVKSHIDLFKAFKIVLQKLPEAKLICCGQNEKNVLAKIVNRLGISGNVEIKGFVDYESLPDLIKKSHLFVLSSLYESQNMAILEASFCGLPVVSTDVGIAPEITGNIVKAGDYEALAEKIIYVIENYDEERKKAAVNLTNLKERYSLKASAEKFYELYISIASSGGK
jgi:glycosyltransferase involved in cell wall biosynthesis